MSGTLRPMSRMTPEVTAKRIEIFQEQFGQAHLYFSYHAAFPLALTPDLLYQLWANFQHDIYGEPLNIPWIAVSDLLFSGLCQEVGHELYEMEKTVRQSLLKSLKECRLFGFNRLNDLSNFLLNYVYKDLENTNVDIRDLAQKQWWVALGYKRPLELAKEVLKAFSRLDSNDKLDQMRILNIVDSLEDTLSDFDMLTIFTQSIKEYFAGNIESAKAGIRQLTQRNGKIQIFDVPIKLPEEINISKNSASNLSAKETSTSESEITHLLILEDSRGKREFILDAPVYSIGRDPKCDIRLVSDFVSRRHATLVQISDYYRIVDGNLKGKLSASGIFINDKKFQAYDLRDEDEISFGPEVKAKYHQLNRRRETPTVPPDEYDITLISPYDYDIESNDKSTEEGSSSGEYSASNRRLILDKYQLETLIDKGLTGRVYKAIDLTQRNIPVAIKMVSKALVTCESQEYFRYESEIIASLGKESPHIVKVKDYGLMDNKIPFYVMEYIEGESLADFLSKSEYLSVSQCINISRQICLGLKTAHKKRVIHRDIKPGNLMLSLDYELKEFIRIIDFGISSILGFSSNDVTPYFVGTPAYSSPEQLESREIDARSDIYSLGIIMYKMLTNTLPIKATEHTFSAWYKAHHYYKPLAIRETNYSAHIPTELNSLIMNCLAKKPNDRPQNIDDILKTLDLLG